MGLVGALPNLWRAALWLLIPVPGAALAAPAPAQAIALVADRQIDLRIDAQPLAAALDAYSLATGVQLFYASELTRGLVSAPVNGRYTVQEAILILLSGTGLRPRLTATNAITLVRTPPHRIMANGESAGITATPERLTTLRLGTLRVEARTDQPLPRRYRFYAAAVRAEVGRALRRNKRLRDGRYRTKLSIWLRSDGRVAHSAVHTSSGDGRIDGIILTTLEQVVVRPDPPGGMPQPIHIDVSAAGS